VTVHTANEERDNRASRVWLYCFLTLAVLLGAVRWHLGRRSAGLKPVAQRRTMEDLELPQLGGGEWRLADHRGQVVLVNYWATWCEPCQDELPGLMQVARDSGPRGLAVVGVSVDEGANAQARVGQFVERYRIAYPVAFSEVPAGSAFGGFRLPTTVLIDRQGRVAKRYVGEVEREDLAQDVAALLAES
jgi:cytochrome c biogenesis protein CcmG, thiol:disulfide interchange protein DsbE